MSEHDKTESIDPEISDRGRAAPEDEISETELETVSGGANSQPLPPHRPTPVPM